MEEFEMEEMSPKARALKMIDEACRLCEEEGIDFAEVMEEYEHREGGEENEGPEMEVASVDDEPAANDEDTADEDIEAKKRLIASALKRKMG